MDICIQSMVSPEGQLFKFFRIVLLIEEISLSTKAMVFKGRDEKHCLSFDSEVLVRTVTASVSV